MRCQVFQALILMLRGLARLRVLTLLALATLAGSISFISTQLVQAFLYVFGIQRSILLKLLIATPIAIFMAVIYLLLLGMFLEKCDSRLRASAVPFSSLLSLGEATHSAQP